MKFIDTVLGFAVLTGPLWLILILLPASIWIAIKIAKRFKPGITRIVGGVGIFLLLFALPFGDEIAGRIYLNYLCSTEAGVKVYKTVELPAEYWDERGRAKFIKANGDLDKTLLGNRFEGHWISEPYSTSLIKIDKRRWQFKDNNANELLGEDITYGWRGGWIESFSPSPIRGATCRDLQAQKLDRDEFIRRERKRDQEFFLNFLKSKIL